MSAKRENTLREAALGCLSGVGRHSKAVSYSRRDERTYAQMHNNRGRHARPFLWHLLAESFKIRLHPFSLSFRCWWVGDV